MSEEIEPTQTNQTTSLSSETSDDNEMLTSTDYEEEVNEDATNHWTTIVNDKMQQQQDQNQEQHQMLNSVFNKQQEIATNLNKVREDALNNLKQNEPKQEFEDDAEEYIKSIGMKVLRDTNPDFTDIVDEARAIDKNFNKNRADELEEAKKNIINKMREYEAKPDHRGWDSMIFKIADDLKKFGYIYNPTDMEG